MYFKLALRNVKKSYQDFLIYFLTLTFSVCLFYSFNSFQEQQAVMEMNASQAAIVESLSMTMNYLSWFVTLTLAFLILYANNFLIKRRKKELGLYMLLGMPKNNISRILVYETFLIGMLSLVSGMIAGFMLSQVLTVVTANLFEVPLNYQFVFSLHSTILTIISFTFIFAIIMVFNSFILNRYQLIDLLNASRKNETMKIKKVWVSILLFLISLACITWAYYRGIHDGLMAGNKLGMIILAGSIGTVLFFLSLAGFMLTMIKNNQRIYFKNLHCFIIRQIHASINSNFLSMSVVCIMLLLSIGALSTGANMGVSLNAEVRYSTPFDFSYKNMMHFRMNDELTLNSTSPLDLQKAIDEISLDPKYIKSSNIINVYLDPSFMVNSSMITDHIKQQDLKAYLQEVNQYVCIVKQSEYNLALKARDMQPLSLDENEAYLYSNFDMVIDGIHEVVSAHPEFNVFDQKVTVVNDDFDKISLSSNKSKGLDELVVLVVPDHVVPKDAKILINYWNADLQNITPEKFTSYFISQMQHAYDVPENIPRFLQSFYCMDIDEIYQANKGLSVVFTYIGIYLGIVFLIASAVILALQQLSNASDNKQRYKTLSKIGADQKLIHQTIFIEIAIYFLLPLALAIVHSIVGIRIVNNLFIMFGKGDMLWPSLFTGGIIVFIYSSYFLLTYFSYRNIVKS